jgi:hypothetical protein
MYRSTHLSNRSRVWKLVDKICTQKAEQSFDRAMNECNALSDLQHVADSERFEMDHANLVPRRLVGTFSYHRVDS